MEEIVSIRRHAGSGGGGKPARVLHAAGPGACRPRSRRGWP